MENEQLHEISNNNIEKVKQILDNSIRDDEILKINEKNEDGNYPFLWTIKNNNIEILKLIINYANDNNIILEINKKK